MLQHPFRLAPYFRTRIWGARDLAPWYDYRVEDAPGVEPIGEVWLTGDQCVVETGPCAGQTLDAVTKQYAADLLGPSRAVETQFPLLMKVLFPHEKLSVQVHPDDAMAQKYGEPRGKTECWYALEAGPDATVALGLNPWSSVESVAAAIAGHHMENSLNWLPVRKGDMFFVDAGTVHAIGPGSVLLETQQNSDLTYRMYDYGRERELHLEKSFEAMKLTTKAGKVPLVHESGMDVLIDSGYFRVERLTAEGAETREPHKGSVQMLFVAAGSARVVGAGFEPVPLKRGQLAVVPAACEGWRLEAEAGAEVIRAVAR